MGELTKTEKKDLVSLFHGNQGYPAVPQPFERNIFLLGTYIAGTFYIENMDEIEPGLQEDDRLDLFREPQNPYDKHAIVVKTISGEKLGYIPRKDNLIFSRLMDAGKMLFARIVSKEKQGRSVEIRIKVFLHE